MGLLMPAAQHTEGQWTGQAQTKVPLQIPGMSSALSPLWLLWSVPKSGLSTL